jgi:hypothetical protein
VSDEYRAKLKSISFPRTGDTKTVERANGAIIETHHADGRIDATVKVKPAVSGSNITGV